MREATRRHGLSLGDAEVIFQLAHSGQPHLTPSELAKSFRITAGSMTTRLDRLERTGYVERSIDPDNRVNIRVTLTPAGERLHHKAVEEIIEVRRELITDAVPAAKLAQLNALLRDVLTHIEQFHPPQVPPQRPAEG